MPTLTTEQKDKIRLLHRTDHDTVVDVWRSPPADANKKVGAPQLLAAGVACAIWEAAKAPKLVKALPEIAAARAEKIAFFLDTIDVVRGDELRIGPTKYKVEGLGVWRTTKAAALSEVKAKP